MRAWRGEFDARRVVPEGIEDVSVETRTGWLHLQAKSRREHRGQFTLADLAGAWRHLAERLAADETARAGLVLERSLPGTRSGFDCVLAESASAEVRAAVEAAVRDVHEPKDFLERTCVIVMSSPVDSAVVLLADRLGRSPAGCVAHEAILRTKLGQLADENGVRDAVDPAALSASDVARLLDDVTESTDPSLLDEAVRTGIAELADFRTQVEDEAFFRGVDVRAGHVVAGLPLPRPEVDRLVDGLAARGVAIAVGPSGTGKSALMWMTAFATRHAVRWYRVRRLNDADVPALVRVVKGQAGAPVGFVVDDLGREDRAGFDRLVEELRDYPNAQVVAACREEDLFVVRSAGTAAQVRPVLGPELAKRIWQELRDTAATTWPAWREPYEASGGLLLEYGHLLTQGTRLAETVTAQIDQRLRDRRDVELDILALVSTADTYGAEIDVNQLASALSGNTAAARSALARLIDEHLVHEHDGFLGGLHEVRSRHLLQAIHRVPPPTLTDTVEKVILLIASTALQPFLTRLLLDDLVPDDGVIEAVAMRLVRKPDLVAFAAALHALRVVGFRRSATQWRSILDEEGVSPTNVGVVGHLVLNAGDDSIFPEPIRRSVARLRHFESEDLRAVLLSRARETVAVSLMTASDLQAAITVLAALGSVGQTTDVDATALISLAAAASLSDIRSLLEVAYVAAPELAVAITRGLGGAAALLDRLQRERPWVRNVRLGVTDDGRPSAEAEYAYVAESAQPNGHTAVVDLAHWLMALAPTAEVAVCRAIDATGRSAGYKNTTIADKAIDRRNLPNLAAVAWNRARARAAIAVVAAPTMTDYAIAAREVVALSKQVTQELAEAFVRGMRPTKRQLADAMRLAEASDRMRPAPITVEVAGPLETGELQALDSVAFVGSTISSSVLPGLFRRERIAPLIENVVEHVDKLPDLDAWRFLEGPAPTADIAVLRRVLVDIHAVMSEEANRADRRAAAIAAGRKGLASAAAVARRRADARAQAVLDQLERALVAADVSAQVVHRNRDRTTDAWITNDLLVLVEVPSVVDWLQRCEHIADLCRRYLPDRISFRMAPVRCGRVVASYGVQVVTTVFPDDSVKTWPGLNLLEETLGDSVRRGFSGLCEASSIVASIRGDQLHDLEVEALDAAALRARETHEHLTRLTAQHETDQLLHEMLNTFTAFAQTVEDEATALREGNQVERSLAALCITGINGDTNEVIAALTATLAACAEWDVDPIDAWERFLESAGNEST